MIENIFNKRKPLILVVDDSKLMRVTFRNFLEDQGYDVIEAKNGIEGLSLFQKLKPDVILMDFVMPGMDGVTACTQLQKLPNGNHTPLIMITSLEDENSVNLASGYPPELVLILEEQQKLPIHYVSIVGEPNDYLKKGLSALSGVINMTSYHLLEVVQYGEGEESIYSLEEINIE